MSKIAFCAGSKVFEEALNAFKFLGWLQKFVPAHKILGPVKEQGMRLFAKKTFLVSKKKYLRNPTKKEYIYFLINDFSKNLDEKICNLFLKSVLLSHLFIKKVAGAL